jgi:hypothetical protein
MYALPMSLTPVNNSSPVSTTPVSDTFTVLKSFTGVSDTGEAPEKSNISSNIRKKSKSSLSLPTGARRSCLKKKNRGQKSGGTVPLKSVYGGNSNPSQTTLIIQQL